MANVGLFDLPFVAREGLVIFLFENLLYGIFLILFIMSALVLHHQVVVNKRSSSGTFGTRVYLILGYLVFIIITFIWGFQWFILLRIDSQIMVDTSYSSLKRRIGSASICFADMILVYRLYIIWGKKMAILVTEAVLVLVMLGLFLCQLILRGDISKRIHCGLGIITILQNVVATPLIAWRLWVNHRLARAVGGQEIFKRVVGIVIESAALYTIWMIVYEIFFFINDGVSIFLGTTVPYIAGIAMAIVNVRVGLGWAAGEEGRSTRSIQNQSVSDETWRRDSGFDDEV